MSLLFVAPFPQLPFPFNPALIEPPLRLRPSSPPKPRPLCFHSHVIRTPSLPLPRRASPSLRVDLSTFIIGFCCSEFPSHGSAHFFNARPFRTPPLMSHSQTASFVFGFGRGSARTPLHSLPPLQFVERFHFDHHSKIPSRRQSLPSTSIPLFSLKERGPLPIVFNNLLHLFYFFFSLPPRVPYRSSPP